MSESFARVETKYLLTDTQAAEMTQLLQASGFQMLDFGHPGIQSLYYDTEDYALIRASLERPEYKEKLRLRAYGAPGTIRQAYVEIKKKYRGIVYKRRTGMPLGQAMAALEGKRMPP